MTLKTVLRGLMTVTLATVGTVVVIAQPAAAATYRTVPVYSMNTYLARPARAMAVLNASTGDTAPVIQYSYTSPAPHNDLMVLELEPGNFVRIKPRHTYSDDGNPHNDKCLAIKNNAGGLNQPIVNATCTYNTVDNDVWILRTFLVIGIDVPVYQFKSVEHGTCIVVQNASNANNARLITHNCDGGGSNHDWTF